LFLKKKKKTTYEKTKARLIALVFSSDIG
jgi:hypothetical protein